MSLPQNHEQPVDPPVTEDQEVSALDASDAPVTAEEEETPEEAASDAALRTWAKDNGIESVPANGKLSAAWREQITNAMAGALTDVATALDPKGEDSVEPTSSDSSISVKATTEPDDSTDEESPAEDSADEPEEELVVEEPEPVAPEFETGTYRSVFKAPNTFVTSQAYTA